MIVLLPQICYLTMSKNAFPDAIELIDALFDYAVTTSANDFWRIDIGQVSEDLAQSIHQITGLNILDYTISIDSSGVRHILNKHGIAENEVTRGQLSVQKRF